MKPAKFKTCLRYPGGKSKALKTLGEWIPSDFKEFRDPFLGGGSIPLMVSQNYPNVPVWVNDKYFFLFNFWLQLRDQGVLLSNKIREIKEEVNGDDEAHRDLFNQYAKEMKDYEPFMQAVAFFILNKCSYSGLTENSTFSKTASRSNFSIVGAEKLKMFSQIIKNWKITNIDYSEVMCSPGEDVFIFLDPPYDIKDFLYGTDRKLHSSFSHESFADNVDKCPHQFMITYNKNEWLENRYRDYTLKDWELRYSMVHRGDKGTKENIKTELLISNYNVDTLETATLF